MRFNPVIFILIMLWHGNAIAQVISIASARALPVGSTVTINGQVTSGSEFGTIRYMQDGTGGIALFSTAVASLQRGDNTTITGTTVEYQNLLEINPVSNWIVNSTSNPDPSAISLTPSQLGESNESMLVKINNVNFTSGGVFANGATYNFTANGESGVVYIRSGHPLVGQPIPATSVILYGINSQYGSQYQVLPRDLNDLVQSQVIAITTQPFPQNITTTSMDISWATDVNGNTSLQYGSTQALELGTLSGPANSANPTINISGLNAASVYYVQVSSIDGNDTAKSQIRPFITRSNSSGTIRTYFNRQVDNSVASPFGNNATQLQNAFDDTLKAYIDRSLTTLDIAIYSFDNSGTSLITQAINDAYNRGVQVRVVADGGNVNAGLQTLNPAIPVLLSPASSPFYYGIMHNKFFIIDANDADPNKPVVMSGSTNWSNNQLNSDRNNIVFIQDQSLAKVYQMEFEEMWGGSGAQPVTSNAKFGPDKKDNTPHVLNINGKKVECYFSPTDNTNSKIMGAIQSADDEMYFATMVYTRNDLAYAMEDRFANHGVYGGGLVNDSSGLTGVSFQIIQSVIGVNMMLYNHAIQTGIMHHKYLIVDQSGFSGDALVLTGSHNWSSAANDRNDENTLIIFDQLTANQFYQEFHNLFNSNGGALGVDENTAGNINLELFPNPSSGAMNMVVVMPSPDAVDLTITDLQGRIIYQEKRASSGTTETFLLENPDLPSGMYLIQAKTPTSVQVKKAVVK